MRKKEVWVIVAYKTDYSNVKMRVLCKTWNQAKKLIEELTTQYPLDIVYAVECK